MMHKYIISGQHPANDQYVVLKSDEPLATFETVFSGTKAECMSFVATARGYEKTLLSATYGKEPIVDTDSISTVYDVNTLNPVPTAIYCAQCKRMYHLEPGETPDKLMEEHGHKPVVCGITMVIDVYGQRRTTVQFTNVELSIVEEAIAHINDNGDVD